MTAHAVCRGTTPSTSSSPWLPTARHPSGATRYLQPRQLEPGPACCLSPSSRPCTAAAAAPGSPCNFSSPTGSPFYIRPLSASDLPCIKRLHKFSKYKGQPVFGSDLTAVDDMLEHAAARASGALGLVICSSDDSSDVVGAVTAQVEEQGEAGQARRQQDGAHSSGAGAGVALVLLSVVVRADQRQLGAGRALLLALADHAARAVGASRIMTDVAAANQPAIDFFTRLGYTASSSGPRPKTLEFSLDLRGVRG